MAQRKRRRHARARSNKTNRLKQPGQGVRSLSFEPLEDRRMLAVFVVNNLFDLDGDGDPVVGSLRQAINLSNANEEADTIIFEDFLFDGPGSGTIFLSAAENGGPLLLSEEQNITILGPGAGVLTIFAPGGNRMFLIDDGNEDAARSITISGITLSGGNPLGDDEDGRGGTILNREALTLQEVEINSGFAPGGGGAIFNDLGATLRVDRSLIRDNNSGAGGGGIQNGIAGEEDNLPRTTIVNSTITGNTAFGGAGNEAGYGGGGVLNLSGTVNIEQSTIVGNSASAAYSGGGVASQGFDAEFDDAMAPTVYSGDTTTNIRSSIIVGNTTPDMMGMPTADDVSSLGMTDDDPPVPFEPQINSLGFNLFGVLSPSTFGSTFPPVNPDITLPPNGPGDTMGVAAEDVFIVEDPDAMPLVPLLADFGGVLPVFMPDINKPGGQMAIDGGDPNNIVGPYDQRGPQFRRAFGALDITIPIMDIGAAEVQVGRFEVNTLVDEADGRFFNVPVSTGTFPFNFFEIVPDFSLREALEFARKNSATGLPDPATITFSDGLLTEDDPVIGTPAPTILLSLGQISLDFPVIIEGPGFDLEIDATGSDPTPGINDGQGSRIFSVSDTVEISNLILRGGDSQEFGGAIFTNGDLILSRSTLLDNATAGSGGAIHVAAGTLLLESSTLSNNIAAGGGGGLFVAGGNVTVSNSTISGNTAASHGGGIANADGNLTIQYSTITLNTAGTLSSGVATYRDAYALTSVRSTIISGNTVNDVQLVKPKRPGTVDSDFLDSLNYNLVGVGNAVFAGLFSMPGDQSLVTDPMLGPLARLGGPTPVHRLLAGSPAIDAGDANPAGLGNVPAQDQRGFPFDRIEGANPIDIGAFEVQDGQLLVGDVTDGANFATFVEALNESNATPTFEQIIFLPTWLGEPFPGNLAITDSVDIFGISGMLFSPGGGLEILVDDGNNASLLDVSITDLRFQNNTRIVSQENLTLTNMQFVNNAAAGNGGAISQQLGKLTIEDSTFIGNTAAGSGGALYVFDGDLEINNSFLTGNSTSAGGSGGAVYIRNGSFTANYTYITGNSASAATGDGGGIYSRDATLMLTDVTISGNSTNGSDSEGGGLAAKDSDIMLVNPAIALNTTISSQSRGGGVFLDGGSLNIQNGNLFGNKTYGQYSSGGGIATVNADVFITGTSVNRNEVFGDDSNGGGIYAVGGNLTVRDSAIISNRVNTAGSNGGGIYTNGDLTGSQTTSIINSTISGNSTLGRGGGLFNAEGLTVIKHSTITNNDAPYVGDAAGVGSFGNSSTTRTEVYSSIIAGNIASQASAAAIAADFSGSGEVNGFDFLTWQIGFGTSPAVPSDGDANGDQAVDALDLDIWELGFGAGDTFSDVERVGGTFDETFLSLGYNLIGEGLSVEAFSAAGDQTGVTDPKLGPLANNGGPTQTQALLEGSPAIDAGDPAFNPNNITPALVFDQRGAGFNRVEGTRIDVGAFELPAPMPLLAPAMAGSEENSEAPLASVANEAVVEEAAFASIRIDTEVQPLASPEMLEETPAIASWTQPVVANAGDPTLRDLTNYVTRLRTKLSPTSRSAERSFAVEANDQAIREAAHDTLLAAFADHQFVARADSQTIAEALSHVQDAAAIEDESAEDLIFELLGEGNI